MSRFAALLAVAASACATTGAKPTDETDVAADYLVASYAARMGRIEDAASRYAAAQAKDPGNRELVQAAADAALAQGDLAAASGFVGEGAPTSALLAQAALDLAKGNGAAARSSAALVHGAAIEEFAARLISVWSLVQDRKREEALTALEAQTPAPRTIWSALRVLTRAMILDQAGEPAAAASAYALARGPTSVQFAHVLNLQAAALARAGQRDEALALLEEAAARFDNPAVKASLAALRAGGQPAPALTAREGAAVSLYVLAMIAAYPSDVEQRAVLGLSLALDADLEPALLAEAESWRAGGRRDLARAALERIPRQSPYYATAQAQAAWSRHADGDSEGAVEQLRRAQAQGSDPVVTRALADIMRGQERYAEAEPLYAELLAAQTEEDWRLLFAYGVTLERLGRWPEAEAALKRAIAAAPDEAEPLNYLGYSWVDRGVKVEEGLRVLEQAAAQRPRAGHIIDSLGWAHYRLGDYARAVALLERAAELDPADPTVNDHLGDAYWQVGRRIEAGYQWRRALSLGLKGEAAEQTQLKLEAGLPKADPPALAATDAP